MTPEEGMITIPLSSYERLLTSAAELGALKDYGVDNWEGYGEAMRSLREEDED